MISIAVLAHNEEADIGRCLTSILGQDGFGPDDRVTVLENGSTDRTAEIVEGIAAGDPRVRLVRIALGDKANAWDVYVFRESRAIPAETHVFMDGDVTMRPGSLLSMQETLAAHPDALAVSSLPFGGRTASSWRDRILTHHGLPGNLYALRDATVDRLRDGAWCLPVGYIGDDTFLMWLLKRRLSPSGTPDKAAIVPAKDAGFDYESISARSVKGLRQLYRRQRTYGMRDIQTKILIDHLLADPAHRPPQAIATLYPDATPKDALFGPFGRLAPVQARKVLFLQTWWRTRRPPERTAKAWFET
ncbi:MAG: glycosyltransferase family 2 protein [Jannaschia sp.]